MSSLFWSLFCHTTFGSSHSMFNCLTGSHSSAVTRKNLLSSVYEGVHTIPFSTFGMTCECLQPSQICSYTLPGNNLTKEGSSHTPEMTFMPQHATAATTTATVTTTTSILWYPTWRFKQKIQKHLWQSGATSPFQGNNTIKNLMVDPRTGRTSHRKME